MYQIDSVIDIKDTIKAYLTNVYVVLDTTLSRFLYLF